MTLLVVALSLIRTTGVESLVGPAITLIPPIHMYRQLRGAYDLSRANAGLRTAILLIFCLFASILFASMLIGLGVLR